MRIKFPEDHDKVMWLATPEESGPSESADLPVLSRRGRDLERPPWCYILWGVPAVLATTATLAYGRSLLSPIQEESLWIVAVAWAGIGCLINGRTCGRIHCRIDGIFFPFLSVLGLLNILSVISFSWSLFWIAFLGILATSFVPEIIWKRYS